MPRKNLPDVSIFFGTNKIKTAFFRILKRAEDENKKKTRKKQEKSPGEGDIYSSSNVRDILQAQDMKPCC